MRTALFMCSVLAMQALRAEEAVVTLHSTVSGNQELPRVMYIVPWQQPGEAQIDYELRGSFANELFMPLDRDEFVRGLAYRTVLEANAVETSDVPGEQNFDNN